jgi:TatD DNase family protein
MVIDTHCHIYDTVYDEDRDKLICQSKDLGIKALILPNVDVDTLKPLIHCAKSHPGFCIPLIGLHPCSVNANYKSQLIELQTYWDTIAWQGIGEIGLDFYWSKTFEKEQEQAFLEQINWAVQKKLPAVLHNRNSLERCLELLEDIEQLPQLVFHCFGESYEMAKRCLNLNTKVMFGIGGVLTFKQTHLRETVKQLGISNIVIETDAPYLAPVPFRGKRNIPPYIFETAKLLSETLKMQISDVYRETTKNARLIFSNLDT